MPLYVYEAVDVEKGCDYCRSAFELTQSIKDDKLVRCPKCGAPIYRVIQAPGIGRSQTDLHYRAKRAGFHTLKRVDHGAYEKLY